MNTHLYTMIPDIEHDEMLFIESMTSDFSTQELDQFVLVYKGRRQDPQNILLFTLVGFLGISGIHRFMMNQIAMGILYLLTAGLCFIGTIIDLINYKNIALSYNKGKIIESVNLIKMNRRNQQVQ